MKAVRALGTESGQRGFTLLELLISMTLTAVLLGMLSSGVYTVVNDWQRESSGLDEELDRSLVILQLERALLGAFPHTYIDRERSTRTIYFYGDAEDLRFASTVSPQRRSGLTAWNLISDPDAGLLLRLSPALSDNPDTRFDLLEPRPLLPGYQARFRYLVQRGEQEKEWLEEWSAQDMSSLPLAVEIELERRDADDDEAPLLIIAPIKANQHDTIEATIPLF